jgi:hypothetical protein
MKKIATLLGVILTAAILCSSVYAGNDDKNPAGAKKTVKVAGYVIDKATGETLSGVKIKPEGSEQSTYTNIDGYFEIEITGENPVLTADFVSYKQVAVASGSPFVRIELSPKDVIE